MVTGTRSGNTQTDVSFSSWNVDELTDVKVKLNSNNDVFYYEEPYFANSDDWWRTYIDYNDNKVVILCGNSWPGTTGKYKVVFEYTKTTDGSSNSRSINIMSEIEENKPKEEKNTEER